MFRLFRNLNYLFFNFGFFRVDFSGIDEFHKDHFEKAIEFLHKSSQNGPKDIYDKFEIKLKEVQFHKINRNYSHKSYNFLIFL